MKTGRIVGFALLTGSTAVHCQSPTGQQPDWAQQQQDALNRIKDFANSFCDPVNLKGYNQTGKITGAAKAKLDGVISKFVDLGVEGAAELSRDDYEGLRREDFAKAVADRVQCKNNIFDKMEKRIPDAPSPASQSGTVRPLLCRPSDFGIYTIRYKTLAWSSVALHEVPKLREQADSRCFEAAEQSERIKSLARKIDDQAKESPSGDACSTAYGQGLCDQLEREQEMLRGQLAKLEKAAQSDN